MLNDDLKKEAVKVANEQLQDAEYSIIYEDERFENLSENDWKEIHDYITHELTTISKSEYKELEEWKNWKAKRTEKFKEE